MFNYIVCEPIQLTQAEVDKEEVLDGDEDISEDEVKVSDGGENGMSIE